MSGGSQLSLVASRGRVMMPVADFCGPPPEARAEPAVEAVGLGRFGSRDRRGDPVIATVANGVTHNTIASAVSHSGVVFSVSVGDRVISEIVQIRRACLSFVSKSREA